MTESIRKFIETLPKTGWRFENEYLYGTDSPFPRTHKRIRYEYYCPLTLLNRMMPEFWRECYAAQGLTEAEAKLVVFASDDCLLCNPVCDVEPIRDVRVALLAHTGLQ